MIRLLTPCVGPVSQSGRRPSTCADYAGATWKKLETLHGESAVSTRDGTNGARDFPNKTENTQNQRRRLDRLWTTLSGFESLPPSQLSRSRTSTSDRGLQPSPVFLHVPIRLAGPPATGRCRSKPSESGANTAGSSIGPGDPPAPAPTASLHLGSPGASRTCDAGCGRRSADSHDGPHNEHETMRPAE